MKAVATITLLIAAIATGVLIAAWQLGVLGSNNRDSSSEEAIPNVRLGMAPRDVRDRFQPGSEGSWQTALGVGDDTVLEWTARDHADKTPNRNGVLEARFEFHLGMLVAIRARTTQAITKEQVTATAKTVTIRSPVPTDPNNNGATTSIIVLARDCPTHKDEADSFASKATATH